VTAADSVQRATRQRTRMDSLRAAGVSEDSIRALTRRTTDAPGPTGQGGGEEDEGPVRTPPPPRVADRPGLNRFAWNMRYPDASGFQGLVMWAAGLTGPMAPPGSYRVRLVVDGKPVATESFRLLPDPRSGATLAELDEQFRFLTRVRARVSEANDAVKTIRWVKKELAAREKAMPEAQRATFASASAELVRKMSVVEDSLYQTRNRSGQDPLNYPIRLNNKLAALAGVASSAESRPTAQTLAVFEQLSAQLDRELATLKPLLTTELGKLNAMLTSAGQKVVEARAVE
jgi:hypothetical protein